jgi:hypothetical protein
MEPGDIFIPALWFHNAFGIAVNVFRKNLEHQLYDKNDPYGNKYLIPANRVIILNYFTFHKKKVSCAESPYFMSV